MNFMFILVVSKLATHKKKPRQQATLFILVFISHVKKKRTTMMNVTLVVVVSKLATQQKKPKQQATLVILVLKDE
jgi:hypothetical protein